MGQGYALDIRRVRKDINLSGVRAREEAGGTASLSKGQ